MKRLTLSCSCVFLALGVRPPHIVGQEQESGAPAEEASTVSPGDEVPCTARLQLRGGSVGGNPVLLNLSGGLNKYGGEIAAEPLELDGPVATSEKFRGWCEGVEIPPGQAFLIRKVVWSGRNTGDPNGFGDFEVWVGRRCVARQSPGPVAVQGEWTGEIRIRHGFEHTVCLVTTNSSWGDVRFEGVLVDDPEALWPSPLVRGSVAGKSGDLPQATLLSRARHKSYETSTFSFEHGVRDDPDRAVTRNDWDLSFGNGGDTFDTCTVGDDRSHIGDLGELSWSALLAGSDPPEFRDEVEAREGHLYVVHTLDGDTEALSLFRVLRLVPGDLVEIEWLLVDAVVLPRER